MELTTSVEFVRLMMKYARSNGLDPDQIFYQADIDPSILDNPRLRINIVKFAKIWLAMEEHSPDRDLGLHLGEKFFNFPGHIVFLLMLNSATVKEALEKLCQYYNLFTYAHSPRLSIRNSMTEMALQYNFEGFDVHRQSNEAMLAGYASVLNRLSEEKIRFEAVYFVHPQPDDISEHQRVFNAPIFFNQPINKLVFKGEYLTLPVLLSSQEILESLELRARDLQEKLKTDGLWSDKVKRAVLIMLGSEKIEIESIAARLAISPRNLQHKLNREGVTFQSLLDFIRREIAKYLLKNESMSINEISLNLGYSEHSVFTRAFKKWLGVTPRQYREMEENDTF